MGIEIRPAGMLAMLDEKARKLDQMKEAFVSSKQGMTQFIADENLQGEAFSAAKNRMSNWLLVLESYETFIDRSKQIDNQLKGIISGTFGSLAEVSEDYWQSEVNRIKSKMDYYNGLADKIERNATEELTTSEKTRVKNYRGSAELLAKGQLQHAEDMLLDIKNYVAQTGNLYCDADFAALDASIDRAIKAITQATFDPKTNKWKKMDTSWVNDLKKNNANVRDTYYIELSKDGTTVITGEFIYANGKKVDINNDDDLAKFIFDSANQNLISSLLGAGFERGGEMEAVELIRKALKDVGIEGMGSVEIKDGCCTFKGFKMADGAGKMTTRCSQENLRKYKKANVASKVYFKGDKFIKACSKGAGYGCNAVFAGLSAYTAYDEEYKAGEGLSEDRRRSNAEVSAGLDLTKSAATIATCAAIGTLFFPGAGTVTGIVVGCVVGLVFDIGSEIINNSDIDGNGKGFKEDVQDAVYNLRTSH